MKQKPSIVERMIDLNPEERSRRLGERLQELHNLLLCVVSSVAQDPETKVRFQSEMSDLFEEIGQLLDDVINLPRQSVTEPIDTPLRGNRLLIPLSGHGRLFEMNPLHSEQVSGNDERVVANSSASMQPEVLQPSRTYLKKR